MKIQYRAVDVSGAESTPHPAEKWFDFVATVAGAIAAVMLILTFLFRVVTVDGHSMVPNLQHGDRLILTDVTTHYERGEIVVISRADDDPLVKRVIAVAGDTIDFQNGSVYLNGVLLDEPYI
ncbi:MAG: signal peptidase I, partial [Clostridia bacterium]|nr:signal peptidase I [Clostridia bacterium]